MKIELLGNTSLVIEVSVEECAIGLKVLVNCRDRWPDFHRPGSSMAYLSSFTEGITAETRYLQDHDCLKVFSQAADTGEQDEAEIILIPESDADRMLLKGNVYTNAEKDQICFLYVRLDGLTFIRTLASR